MNDRLREVVVLGGGSAGWLVAGLLAAEHGELKITLIESSDVPIIGVGEGTWPSMRDTLRRIGLAEPEFIHIRVAMEASPNVDALNMRLKKLGGTRRVGEGAGGAKTG